MRIFWKKVQKPRNPVCVRQLGAQYLDPRAVSPVYYYNFFEFVSSAKCVLSLIKKEQNNYSKCAALLLPNFCA